MLHLGTSVLSGVTSYNQMGLSFFSFDGTTFDPLCIRVGHIY